MKIVDEEEKVGKNFGWKCRGSSTRMVKKKKNVIRENFKRANPNFSKIYLTSAVYQQLEFRKFFNHRCWNDSRGGTVERPSNNVN